MPERCNAHILLDILPFSDSWESVEGTSHTIGSGRGSRTNSHDCFMPRRARLRLTAPHADARHSTLEISIFCSDFFWSSRTVDNIIYSKTKMRLLSNRLTAFACLYCFRVCNCRCMWLLLDSLEIRSNLRMIVESER